MAQRNESLPKGGGGKKCALTEVALPLRDDSILVQRGHSSALGRGFTSGSSAKLDRSAQT